MAAVVGKTKDEAESRKHLPPIEGPDPLFCAENGNFIIHFLYATHVNFVIPEFNSLLEMFGLDPKTVYHEQDVHLNHSPFLRVKLPSVEVAKQLCSRAILIRAIYELWGVGTTLAEAVESVRDCPEERKEPYFGEDQGWSVTVHAFGKKFKQSEQREARDKFADVLLFRGPVVLTKKKKQTPEGVTHMHLFVDFCGLSGITPFTITLPDTEVKPRRVIMGREIGMGRRDLVDKYDLKKRPYLGPTSMDNELAFVMVNQGQVGPGKILLDPFVGTGSMLIPGSVFGAQCLGTDIDIRVLKGKNNKTVFTNFEHYGLPKPELLRMDFSPSGFCFTPWAKSFVHAIVCDPPYGIRAGARKVGSRKAVVKEIKPEHVATHIPMTQPYETAELMFDLLDTSAQVLVLGGRLVYLLPVVAAEYTDDQLPTHPALELVANSEQPIAGIMSRRLITMKKVKEYDEVTALVAQQRSEITAHSVESFTNIREKVWTPKEAEAKKSSSTDSGSQNEDTKRLKCAEQQQ